MGNTTVCVSSKEFPVKSVERFSFFELPLSEPFKTLKQLFSQTEWYSLWWVDWTQHASMSLALWHQSIFKVWLICCSKWKAEYTAASKQCKHHTLPLWNYLVPARTPHPWVAKRKSGAKHCVHKNHKVNNDNSYIPPASRRTKGLWRWHALCGCECRLQPVTMHSARGQYRKNMSHVEHVSWSAL